MKRAFLYGDSNMYGYDPRGPVAGRYAKEERWTEQLAERLKGSWDIHVNGISGRTIPTEDFERSMLEKGLSRATDEGKVDLVAIMLGTNDYLNMPEPDVDAVAEKWRSMAKFLMKTETFRKSGASLMMIAPPVMKLAEQPESAKYDTTNGKLSAALEEVAGELDILFVDAGAWQLDLTFDGTHLSVEGNRQFADCMEKVLKAL